MLLQLAIIAIVIALLPLSIIWFSKEQSKFKKLAAVTLFLTLDLIVFGAFTRLTDSGLGCPDWPGCYGQANPFQSHAEIHAAQTLMPTGPVTVVKAWIEMTHRYFAMVIGVLMIALMIISWRMWIKSRRQDFKFSPWLPTSLFMLVCIQGVFGMWTVTLKLQPIIVTLHLLLGLTLLGGLTWLYARQTAITATRQVSPKIWWPAGIALAVLSIQIAFGGWVSSNYAVLACTDFPLCNNALIPPMDFTNGFTLWRDLGKTATSEFIPFTALTAIHWTHRSFAIVVVLVVGWVAYLATANRETQNVSKWIFILLAIQFASGISTIYFSWPLIIAVIHSAGAALLVMLLVVLNYKMKFSQERVTHAPAI